MLDFVGKDFIQTSYYTYDQRIIRKYQRIKGKISEQIEELPQRNGNYEKKGNFRAEMKVTEIKIH